MLRYVCAPNPVCFRQNRYKGHRCPRRFDHLHRGKHQRDTLQHSNSCNNRAIFAWLACRHFCSYEKYSTYPLDDWTQADGCIVLGFRIGALPVRSMPLAHVLVELLLMRLRMPRTMLVLSRYVAFLTIRF